ncbi:glycosyltransferase family 4 protein [Frigoribacterium sp. 2-23]|uniref:glycosyltransferase family 4 protein n=1 Tax=Frigoribacterium sp. 2-23 TaxID=3415006 RepID=UPI003C6FDD69
MSLSVLVDATSIPPNRGGVARYIAGLLQGLDEADVSVSVVVKRGDRSWLSGVAPGHRYVDAPRLVRARPVRLAWEQLGLPLLARRLGVAVLHCPHYTFPLGAARRSVVTLHDATFFSDPAAHSRLKRVFFRTWITLARRWTRATVTPSQATADEIHRYVPSAIPNAVAPLGVDRSVFHPATDDAMADFRRAHGLSPDDRWIAFLGTVEPRKSVPALIDAHAALTASVKGTPPLLVAGGLGWDESAVHILRAAGDVPGAGLRYLGYLPLDQLSAFLGGSELVVYPSTGEGFGLPVLEAMASGGAVLTTRRLALPEVAGDAAAYSEPDAESLHHGMKALLADDERRRSLVLNGLERSAGFTWRACAEAHQVVYS